MGDEHNPVSMVQKNPKKQEIKSHSPEKVKKSVQGQVGWSSERPGLVEGVPAYGRRVGTR